MTQLRLLSILLITVVTLFFNIERLDFGQENTINLDTFAYVLGFVAVITVSSARIWRQISPAITIVIWAIIYTVIKLLLFLIFSDRPVVGGIYTYLFITELAFILGLVWLAQKFSMGLHEFAEAVKTITFADTNNRIHSLDEADDQIQTELFRSRHNHHPLSVIIIEPDSMEPAINRVVREVQQNMMDHYIINTLAMTLSSQMRRSDLVLEEPDRNRLILVCPDTNISDSQILVDYIEDIVSVQLDMSIMCGKASFPQEAYTFEELVHRAEMRLNDTNRPSAAALMAAIKLKKSLSIRSLQQTESET